jgi:hypothetical protein
MTDVQGIQGPHERRTSTDGDKRIVPLGAFASELVNSNRLGAESHHNLRIDCSLLDTSVYRSRFTTWLAFLASNLHSFFSETPNPFGLACPFGVYLL